MSNNYPDTWKEEKENKYYKEYLKEKDKIKEKYPQDITSQTHYARAWYVKEQRELHLQYIKEVCDLMFEPNGKFQEFIWDSMPAHKKEEMEKRIRGSIYSKSV